MIHGILGIWNYWIVIILMMTGLFIVISRHNLVKKIHKFILKHKSDG